MLGHGDGGTNNPRNGMKKECSVDEKKMAHSLSSIDLDNNYDKTLKCPNCSKLFDYSEREKTCSIKCKIISEIVKNKNSCWFYKLNSVKKYSRVSWNGEWSTTRRAAYNVFVGEIPKNNWVYVNCGESTCINPDHLFLGKPYNQKAEIHGEISLQEFPPVHKQIMRKMIQSGKNFLVFILGKARD